MMQSNTSTVASRLTRYLVVAVLIRAVNDGATVGLALLALAQRPELAGILVAALVAPHLLGPWLGRILSWPDSRRILAAAFTLYGVGVGAAAFVLDSGPVGVTVLLVALAGCAGPMFGGGLTSRLPSGEASRARALDSATWGIATVAGPGLAAVTSLAIDPGAAVLVMAAGALLAAGMVLTLPPGPEPADRAVSTWACLSHAARTKPLRGTLTAVGLTGLGLGAVPVATPLLSVELGVPSGGGGLLIAAYGLGSLAGSLGVAARPVSGSPVRTAAYCLHAMALAIGLAAVVPSFGLALAGFAGLGVANGMFLTAVLAVCRSYAPVGGHTEILVLSTSVRVTGAAVAGVWSGLAIPAGARTILAAAGLSLLAAGVSAYQGARSRSLPVATADGSGSETEGS